MITRVVAIRHGKPLNEGFAEDALRPLSDEGKEIQKRTTELLRVEGIQPDLILTSPLLRAQQTAQIATDAFEVTFENEPALGNNFNSQKLLERIPTPEKNMTIFLFGHAPTLGQFVNDLVGEIVLPGGLSKSCAAVVDFEDQIGFGHGKFIAYIKP